MRKKGKLAGLDHHKERIHRLRKHPFIVPVITLLVLVFITLAGLVSFNATTLGPADSRVVHVYADGHEQTLPTRAPTVGNLLERLNIPLNDGDVVEPSVDTQILEDDFTVNIYRARPVTVVDGDKRITILTAEQSPRVIAKAAGLKLYPEDEVNVTVPDEVIKEGVVGEKLVVDRSIPVALILFGNPVEARTHAKTVGELLQEKGLDPAQVTVSPPADTPLKANDVVYVTSPDKNIVIEEQTIDTTIEVINDPTVNLGVTQVREEGSPGKKVVIYEVDKADPSKKTVIQELIAIQPVPRVEVHGAKVVITGTKTEWMASAGISPSDYVYADYIISRESGWCPTKWQGEYGVCNPYHGAPTSIGYGLCQATPPQKMGTAGGDWATNPVTQLKWCTGYAQRYGGWSGAYSWWQTNHWW